MNTIRDEENAKYRDIYGCTYVVKKELSRGGQGAVFTTMDSNILLKLALKDDEIDMDDSKNERYYDLRTLPVDQDMHITFPKATLVGVSGYVMEMLEEMESFEDSFVKVALPQEENLVLKKMCGDDKKIYQMLYLDEISGGKRRRMEAFMKAGVLLAQLHANGLVYGDFSLNNVFISTDKNYCNVWLIDADNIANEAKAKKRVIYTPFIVAPEVALRVSDIDNNVLPVRGCGNTFSSDVYTFVMCLFKELFFAEPFYGEKYRKDFDMIDTLGLNLEDIEEKLMLGEYSYIQDEEISDEDENNNHAKLMQSMENIVTPDVKELFQRTLGDTGKWNRMARPTMFEWVWALARNNDLMIHCSHCGMDYLYNRETENECCWCGEKEDNILVIKSYYYEGNIKGHSLWEFKHELYEGIKLEIPKRMLDGFDVNKIDDKFMTIEFKDDSMIISLQGSLKGFYSNDGEEYSILKHNIIIRNISSQKKFYIICKDNLTSKSILLEGELK